MLILAAVLLVLAGKSVVLHALHQHRHAHETVARAADTYGWDPARRAQEVRHMKRRQSLRAKAARIVRGRR